MRHADRPALHLTGRTLRPGIAEVVLGNRLHQRLVDGVAEVRVPGQHVAKVKWQGKYPSGIGILKSSASGHHAVGGGDKEGSGEQAAPREYMER
jgi:hypothetical protein